MRIEFTVPPSDAAVYASSSLQFEHFLFNSQLNFPARISVKYGCAVLSFSKVCTENVLLSFPAHFSARFCFAPVTNQKLQNAALCAKKKKKTVPRNTQTQTYTNTLAAECC